jgi:hypothetical protein
MKQAYTEKLLLRRIDRLEGEIGNLIEKATNLISYVDECCYRNEMIEAVTKAREIREEIK